MSRASAADRRAAAFRRLAAVAPHLPGESIDPAAFERRGAGALLDVLARRVQESDDVEAVWLLTAGFLGFLPTPDELRALRRRLRLVSSLLAADAVLALGEGNPFGWAVPSADVEVVVDGVVLDVDFAAKHRHNTGVQRVVRHIAERWVERPEVRLAAWTSMASSYRALIEAERSLVVAWDGRVETTPPTRRDPLPLRLLVPHRSVVVLPEVPPLRHSAQLAALAEFSGNRVAVVGHDAIPVVSADTVDRLETERFIAFLGVVKHADRVAGVSESARSEFAGFASAAVAQGLPGPDTVAVPLPSDVAAESAAPVGDGPLRVVCVGSTEPRKNQDAVLAAAERLWGEGLAFELHFYGGGSAAAIARFDREVERLRGRGRAVAVHRWVSDQELLEAYRSAGFTVFPSLHEGFGLPVAESLALGVPVITTDYGSTAEIARGGGCLIVDPRADDELVDAMRRLLTDPGELARLRAEAAARPARGWDHYAAELWASLIAPLREDAA